MNDRELLELAAKAAGIHVQWDNFSNGFICLSESGNDVDSWNPLFDDGDCARMEVVLELSVDIEPVWVVVERGAVRVLELYDDHGGDKNKARRVASVKLAAMIGRAMP